MPNPNLKFLFSAYRRQKTNKQPEFVKPARSLIGGSFPCQQIAAHVHNQAIRAIGKHNYTEIAFRNRQVRQYSGMVRIEAIVAGFTLLCTAGVWLAAFCGRNPKFALMMLLSLCLIIQAIFLDVQVSNINRSNETLDLCSTWLDQNLGNETRGLIEHLEYNKDIRENIQSIIEEFEPKDGGQICQRLMRL